MAGRSPKLFLIINVIAKTFDFFFQFCHLATYTLIGSGADPEPPLRGVLKEIIVCEEHAKILATPTLMKPRPYYCHERDKQPEK